ncbi:hypothetical protein K1T71_007209 [Dendrolimus kikuchii]|uniref:Uncharacterized protein n=1 Tax=Dendrolimus kikuchii TaxID=765133 RepID=A0ACC1D0D3_9NEOP|nr:hypothetical protein K1T71_007209 [Dendrolimus kikuchii]
MPGNRVGDEMPRKHQPKEAAAWTKLKLLMWKNFLQQWRHRAQTATELLLPILTMTLVLILRWQIEPSTVNTIHYQPFPAHTINSSTPILAVMNITKMSIAYSPTSPELDDVVRSAVSYLLVRNIDVIIDSIFDLLPGNITIEIPPDININSTAAVEFIKRFIPVTGYDNSSQLGTIYALEETTREVIAAVEFDDDLYGATKLSSNLSYSLRFPEIPRLNAFFHQGARTWRTDLVFPSFEITGPRNRNSQIGGRDPGYVAEMFLALQQSISIELIARCTGVDAIRDYSIHMQRYPHPAYVQDSAVEALQFLFPMFIMLSFSYTAVNIVRAVTVEKELQLKEAMKIMGLPTWLHWTAWFCKQFIFLFVTVTFIVVLLKMNWFSNDDGFNEYAVFTNTPWTVLFFFLLLYLMSTIFFGFMISGIFSKGSTAALCTGVIWFLTYIPAFLLTMDISMSTPMQIFTCLLHNTAMSYGFVLLLGQESTGGLQWGEFFSSPSTESTRFVFGHVILMLSLDCVLYMLIALYLEQVLPGPYGTPRKWYFPFQKSYWFQSKTAHSLDMIPDSNINDDLIKERDPTGHEIGVKMNKLTKIYGSNTAVNNLTMNIYDDQITVLLGHNGAGKSTTISMLTGNLDLSNGSVHVAGYDISSQLKSARSHIGLCPQHNVLFNELTVKEHLQFFATLKGFTGAELKQDIDSLITKLELEEKRDFKSEGLSGGQKRRLCVGIALSGATRVVLLDEPTSGMDPASRRALWDLLQREKKGRTIILTTHFMDEADILGDRIAIMANGQLQCIGSPYFLKRHYGVGYTLVIVKTERFNIETCTDVIKKYIPGIGPKEDKVSEVTFSLTNEHSQKFEEMLNDLEKNNNVINFKNYGLVATTLEDVFMSVGSDVAPVHSVTDDEAPSTVESTSTYDISKISMDELNKEEEGVTGITLLWQRILAVWLKLWLVWTRSWWLILLQLLIPLLLINTTLLILEYIISFVETVQVRPLTVASGYTNTETLLSFNGTSLSSLGALAKEAYENIFRNAGIYTMIINNVQSLPIDQYYLERAADPEAMASMRHSVVIGATFDEVAATAWFSNFGYHDIAASLATVHEALLKAFNSTATINVFNHPLEATYDDRTDIQTMATLLSMQLSSGIGSSVGIISTVFIMFYIKERISGAKLLQKAAGLQPLVMWGSASVFDWLWFCIICITIPLSCAIFQVSGISTISELGRMYLICMVYGAAMLPFNYVFSGAFSGPALGFVVIFFVNMLLGMMGPQIVEALSSPFLDTEDAARILDIILQFFPLYSLVTAARELVQIGITEHGCLQGCEYISILIPDLKECTMQTMCEHFSQNCCVRENPFFDWEAPGVLRYIVVMLITSGIFWAILMIQEYKIVQKIFTIKKTPPPIDERTVDEDVADEVKHVLRFDKSSLNEHGLVARNLSKYYGKHLAVDQISFSVNDSECFGLLGVNGAGKTTTFKMLMGDETISSGEAFVSGHSVRSDLPKVYENIGYCPQFDALFGELTGRETLQLFSLMRGLSANNSVRAEALAQSLGFLEHLDKKVDEYSGGTKRKLNTAVAFMGRTRLVFVDEPTTGVDPAAKRHVWRSMRGVQRSGRGVVLTSHSMEECEALCSRLTIMVNGRFQCLGTPQHLKNKFSQGFTLTVKLRVEDMRRSVVINSLDAVKEYINANFLNPKMMEEYQGLLTYYLPDRTMPWSKMFGIMERAKRDLEIEDYSISQTTLEQIFLQFTKYQKEGTVVN